MLPSWDLLFSFVFVIDSIPSWKEMKEAFLVKLQNNIRAISYVKQNLHWSIGKNVAYWEESEQIEALAKSLVFPKYSWGSGCVEMPGKFCNLFPHLETAFLALKLIKNCYINMNISFSWKSNKIWNQWDFKNPKFSTF